TRLDQGHAVVWRRWRRRGRLRRSVAARHHQRERERTTTHRPERVANAWDRPEISHGGRGWAKPAKNPTLTKLDFKSIINVGTSAGLHLSPDLGARSRSRDR